MTLQELREQITTGKHEEWNKAVSIFGLTRTPQMGLEVRGAFLVLAFRHGPNAWGLVERASITKDNALKMIADSYQEASVSSLFAVAVDRRDGKLTYPVANATEELVVASMPVGLVFVGPCRNGEWADEVAFVGVRVLAGILGRSEEEELRLLEEFVFDAAGAHIRKLQSN